MLRVTRRANIHTVYPGAQGAEPAKTPKNAADLGSAQARLGTQMPPQPPAGGTKCGTAWPTMALGGKAG